MSPIVFWLAVMALSLSAAPLRANPVAYGQQLCVMVASGIRQQQAWDYIAAEHMKAAMANPQSVIPWYSAASAGWTLGTAIGRRQQAQAELNAMKPDVFKVARSTCPRPMSTKPGAGGNP